MFRTCVVFCCVALPLGLGQEPATPPAAGEQRPARQQRGAFGVTFMLHEADANRDSKVSAEEWSALLAALARRDDGSLDAADLKRRLVVSLLDSDRDGKVTPADVEPVFARLDQDGDLNLGRAEAMGGGARSFGASILAVAADADQNGEVSNAEWQTLLTTLPAGKEIAASTLTAWIKAAETAPPDASDRPGAMTPAVFLMGLERGFDADQNGRLEPADLQAAFEAADQNKDGALDEGELSRAGRPARNPGGSGGGRGGFGIDVAERRKLPPLMPWQRNLDDALALVAASGRPLLICVNMDGESASESLAWGRYRDPAFAKLAEGFACLIVSPDRRNARDHDDRGRRIADPRFGRVINTEHIDIEPVLFERYFQGQRVAPRHVGVDKDGKILFDIYLTQGLEPVDEALRKHGKPPAEATPPASDLEEGALLASTDAAHRQELESRFVAGDEATRMRLAGLCFAADRPAQHPEVLRLALFDDATAVRHRGARTLADNLERAPLALFVEGLRIAHGDQELTARFVEALGRCEKNASDEAARKGARRLASILGGLAATSPLLEASRWRQAIAVPCGPTTPPSEDEIDALSEKLESLDRRLKTSPKAGDLHLEVAATTLRFARIRLLQGKDAGLLLEDARAAATRASDFGAPKGTALGHAAWASLLLGDLAAAAPAAEAALPELLPQANSTLTATVLEVVARARVRAVFAALDKDGEAPASLLADARTAFELLLAHPEAGEETAAAYLDFLDTLEAYGLSGEVVRRAMARWPLAGRLHEHRRAQALREGGAAALEAAYAKTEGAAEHTAGWTWYAGLATLVAAERRVQTREVAGALASYQRSVERFDAAIAADGSLQDSAQHYASLALAGRARLAADAGDLAAAAKAAREALERRPESAAVSDGLGNTPAQNVAYVARALTAGGQADQAKALREAAQAAGVTLEAAPGRGR